jgi:MFS family permease
MSILVSPILAKGHFRACFNGGCILLVAGVFLTSFCTAWWQLLLAQGILTGIGMGLAFGSGVIVLLSYFSTHVGLATGIAAAGSSTGAYSL